MFKNVYTLFVIIPCFAQRARITSPPQYFFFLLKIRYWMCFLFLAPAGVSKPTTPYPNPFPKPVQRGKPILNSLPNLPRTKHGIMPHIIFFAKKSNNLNYSYCFSIIIENILNEKTQLWISTEIYITISCKIKAL